MRQSEPTQQLLILSGTLFSKGSALSEKKELILRWLTMLVMLGLATSYSKRPIQ